MADAQGSQIQGSPTQGGQEAIQATTDAKDNKTSKTSQFGTSQFGQRIGDVTSRVKEQGVLNTLQSLSFAKASELLMPLGVFLILALLLMPLPAFALDILLTFSITTSIVILMTVIFVDSPVRLSSFPTILLLAALLRLGLNIASTRLILANGHEGTDAAGVMIEAFGNFVAAGNYIIGLIVFGILVIINFVVITKGAGRIAEVSARFSLDGLPGKQMAIDAEFTAGHITEEEATRKRQDLAKESTFYGSMDGASKFVRGDAMAGLLITFINIIGGIVIGVVQRDMDIAVAAENYTLLTIGDGLVSQIPGLIVSVSAGFLITKSGVEGKTEDVVSEQFGTNPLTMIIPSFILLTLSTIPGLPAVPFLILGLGVGALGVMILYKQKRAQAAMDEFGKEKQDAKRKSPTNMPVDGDGTPLSLNEAQERENANEEIRKILDIDQVRVDLGYGLLPTIKSNDGLSLKNLIVNMRKNMAHRFGVIVPSVRIMDNLELPSHEYIIYVKDIESGRGELRPNMLLCFSMDRHHDGKFTIRGEKTREPIYNMPAVWIRENQRDEATFQGYTVIEPVSVIVTHLNEIVQKNMAELLSYNSVQNLLDMIAEKHRPMVQELVPKIVSISLLQKVLQNLLHDHISIRDLAQIIAAIGDAAMGKMSFVQTIEQVRSYLSKQICHSLEDEDGLIRFMTLGHYWEDAFLNALQPSPEGDYHLVLDPNLLREFINKLKNLSNDLAQKGIRSIMLVNSSLRPHMRATLQRHLPDLQVISFNEVHVTAKYEMVATID